MSDNPPPSYYPPTSGYNGAVYPPGGSQVYAPPPQPMFKDCNTCQGKGYFDSWGKPYLKTSMHKEQTSSRCNGTGQQNMMPGQWPRGPPGGSHGFGNGIVTNILRSILLIAGYQGHLQ